MTAAIRPGTAADWPACWQMDVSYSTDRVWQLHSQLDGEARVASLAPVRLPRPVTLRDPFWGEAGLLRDSQEGALLLAHSQTGLVGFAVLLADDLRNVDLLPMLAVVAHARRQGIGRRLLAAVIETAQTRARRALCVTLQARNYPAISFLQANGFTFTGYDEQFYPSTDVAVFFSHRLRAA